MTSFILVLSTVVFILLSSVALMVALFVVSSFFVPPLFFKKGADLRQGSFSCWRPMMMMMLSSTNNRAGASREAGILRVVAPILLLSCSWQNKPNCNCFAAAAFSSSSSSGSASFVPKNKQGQEHQPAVAGCGGNNVLILDHLNINHEKGRHDWLKAFYFDFLGCAVDPRKAENLEKGEKTLWANIGANQFHLPEGKTDAQVLDGVVTLVYPDLSVLLSRYQDSENDIRQRLQGSKFAMDVVGDDDGSRNGQQRQQSLVIKDPWGTKFRIIAGYEEDRDCRGNQPGGLSDGLALKDLTIYTPIDTNNMAGVGRFYEMVLGAPVLEVSENKCVVSVGPKQTLTFQTDPNGRTSSHLKHEDLKDDGIVPPDGYPTFSSNYGPHVSMYVANLRDCYRKAERLGVAYVNPRFKRRAYNLEQAIDDCMFRCLDIVDPLGGDGGSASGPILRLEHEIRSVVKRDGTKYKSCPFDEIPDECLQ